MDETTSTDNGGILSEMRLAWQLMRDPESPFYLKLLPLLAIVYFVAPEYFVAWPLATPIDDVAVFYAALKGIVNLAPPHLVAKYTGDPALNYVDGEYEVVEGNDDSAEKTLSEDIIINPDQHDWN